jgi:hypothetical protein
MDFATRDSYRKVVERLSRATALEEAVVPQKMMDK